MQPKRWLLATANPNVTFKVVFQFHVSLMDWRFSLFGSLDTFLMFVDDLANAKYVLKRHYNQDVTETVEV